MKQIDWVEELEKKRTEELNKELSEKVDYWKVYMANMGKYYKGTGAGTTATGWKVYGSGGTGNWT